VGSVISSNGVIINGFTLQNNILGPAVYLTPSTRPATR